MDKPRAIICLDVRSKSVRETRLIYSEIETDLMTRNGFSLGMVSAISNGGAIPAW